MSRYGEQLSLISVIKIDNGDSQAQNDDKIEYLKADWYEGIIRMGTIGDNSCFTHSLCKLILPTYQNTNIYNKRIAIAYGLRRDLARKLLEINPNFSTENDAISYIGNEQDLTRFSRVREVLTLLGIKFETLKKNEDEEPKDDDSKEIRSQKYDNWFERQMAFDKLIVNSALSNDTSFINILSHVKNALGYPSNVIPFNSYFFSLNKGNMPFAALQSIALVKDQQNMDGMATLNKIVEILIDLNKFLGEGDAIQISSEMFGINIIFCKVYKNDVHPTSKTLCPKDNAPFIFINAVREIHYEAMGIVEINNNGKEYVRTMFNHDHPFVIAADLKNIEVKNKDKEYRKMVEMPSSAASSSSSSTASSFTNNPETDNDEFLAAFLASMTINSESDSNPSNFL